MTIYSKPENALVAHDRLLDFISKVSLMWPDEVIMVRERAGAAGYSPRLRAAVMELIDAAEDEDL